jgi:hypothetical protein
MAPETSTRLGVGSTGRASFSQVDRIARRLVDKKVDEAALLAHFGIRNILDLPMVKVTEVLNWIDRGGR